LLSPYHLKLYFKLHEELYFQHNYWNQSYKFLSQSLILKLGILHWSFSKPSVCRCRFKNSLLYFWRSNVGVTFSKKLSLSEKNKWLSRNIDQQKNLHWFFWSSFIACPLIKSDSLSKLFHSIHPPNEFFPHNYAGTFFRKALYFQRFLSQHSFH